MKTETRNLICRYLLATVGMFLVAIGVALSIISNLGTSPLSCPAYVANLKFPGISVGTFTWIVNCIYIFIQLGVLKKKFKKKYLMQIVASVIFGYLIDAGLWIFGWLHPGNFISRLGVIILSCFITALGTSIEVVAKAWMLSAEMTVYCISNTYNKKFNIVKIIMDSTLVVITMVAAWFFFRNPFGDLPISEVKGLLLGSNGSIVIGVGTIISAFLIGWFMKLTDPIAANLYLSFSKDLEDGREGVLKKKWKV